MNTKQKCILVTGEYKKTCGVVIPHSLEDFFYVFVATHGVEFIHTEIAER